MSKLLSKQALAINYKILKKRREKREQELIKRNLKEVFKYQTKYKSLINFLKATPEKMHECKNEAIKNITKKINNLKNAKTLNIELIAELEEALKCIN